MGTCEAGGGHMGRGNYTLSYDAGDAVDAENYWRWCSKCMLLCYDGSAACAAGGSHINFGSGFYILPQEHPNARGQDNWRWCKKCYGISFAGGPSIGACPATGVHDHSDSGNYVLRGDSHAGSQDGWSWCNKCQLLWFSSNGPRRCPSGPYHDNSGSGKYAIDYEPTTAHMIIRLPTTTMPLRRHGNMRRDAEASNENPPPPYSAISINNPSKRDEEPTPSRGFQYGLKIYYGWKEMATPIVLTAVIVTVLLVLVLYYHL